MSHVFVAQKSDTNHIPRATAYCQWQMVCLAALTSRAGEHILLYPLRQARPSHRAARKGEHLEATEVPAVKHGARAAPAREARQPPVRKGDCRACCCGRAARQCPAVTADEGAASDGQAAEWSCACAAAAKGPRTLRVRRHRRANQCSEVGVPGQDARRP